MFWLPNLIYSVRTALRSDTMENAMQGNAPTRTEPTQSLLSGKPYERGADVQATWRRFGWVPPSEQKDKK